MVDCGPTFRLRLGPIEPIFWNLQMADWIEPGQKAPAFTLPADDGNKVRLADHRGRPVVLYFYPKDNTPGCTREACAFRDRQAELTELGAVVLGVSADSVASHVDFRKKFGLNFPLLADVDHASPKSMVLGARRICTARSRLASSGARF